MEEQRYDTSAYMQVPLGEKSVTTEISGDFTLPDYHPEIKRLLRVSASILPPSKYVGDSEAELTGGIDYYVLYTGSDNQVYCAPLSSEYKITVPMDKNELSLVNVTADADIIPDMTSGRVTSPRKLNIKCRLKSVTRMYGDTPIDKSYASLGGENQILLGRSETTRRLFAQSEMIRLSDEMIQSASDEEIRVINADGRVLVNESTAANGAVNCKGELYLKLLMCREPDGVPYTTTRRIPFNQTTMVDGADANCETCAKGKVCEISINVEEGRIGIDVGVMLEMSVCKNETVTYVKDAYSTTHNTECTYRTVPYLDGGRAFNSNFTQSDSMTLDKAGLTPEHKIVDIAGCAYPDSAILEGEKWVFTGKTKFALLTEKDGEYSNAEIEMPYRYAVDSKHDEGNEAYAYASAEIISARARLDGERIGIDAEVMMKCIISNKQSAKMLDSVSFGDECQRSRGEYVVCYPAANDNLWSIAKKYGTTTAALAATNKLSVTNAPDSTDTLSGIHYLIV